MTRPVFTKVRIQPFARTSPAGEITWTTSLVIPQLVSREVLASISFHTLHLIEASLASVHQATRGNECSHG